VFSTNAEPFEAERSYSKFEAYALLRHGGDFKGAARELRRQGYGAPGRRADGTGEGTSPDPPGSPYFVEGGRGCRRTYGRDGEETGSYPLCNFTARIAEEVVLDDGSGETDCHFTIEGTLADGTPLPPARVRATEFASLAWTLKHWGARAVPKAG